MSLPRCLLIGLFCLGPILPSATQAAAGLPQMQEQRLEFSLQDRMAIKQVADRIVAQTGPEFTGYIQLVWFDEAYSSGAQRLRQRLVSNGISLQRIMLIQESGADRQPPVGLLVRIKQPARRLSPCRYATQNYRFNLHDDQGCALNNMLSSSLINPHKNNY
ncbi:hypothetical protein COO59_10140 [Mixta theicola]|uniref:Uncharacterized protein n=1 Tax=Mixta theicola TaxID=1458355 RepID=A0A2K1Q9Y4_9GAMM|nr:hypothetical protein [Mixta theicola]PNS11842.1 hypothetical protein COO59_10140 [Mixta theicola]GLR07767.1 hypothetical protein GCM10007905_04860 [Mixta theicola]